MTPRRPLVCTTLAFVLSASALANAPVAAAAEPAPTASASPTPEEVREALNREQAYAAQNQVGENYAREDNRAEAIKARATAIKRQQDAYAAELAAYAARRAQYETELARWRASLPQCKPGQRHPCPAS